MKYFSGLIQKTKKIPHPRFLTRIEDSILDIRLLIHKYIARNL